MTDSPLAARPAEPFADVKARAAAAVEAAREEILDLSHRIHANPEPAFEERSSAAAWVAEVVERHGLRGGAPGREPRDGRPGPADRRPGARRAADRGPGRVRRAAGPRPRLRPQHDGGVRRRRRHRAGGRPRRLGRRGRVPRHARGGARERQGDHAARRPVRGPGRGAPVPPLRPQPRRDARRSRPRTWWSCSRGLQSHAASEPWNGEERARRDDRAVRLGGPVAPAAPAALPGARDHPGGRHGGQHHPGPDPRLVHDPQRRPAVLRGHEGAVPAAVRGGGPGGGRDRRGRVLRRRHHDEAQRTLAARWVANAEAYGIADEGMDPIVRLNRHGQRLLGDAGDPPRPRDHRRADPRPLDRVPGRGRPGPRADRTVLLASHARCPDGAGPAAGPGPR